MARICLIFSQMVREVDLEWHCSNVFGLRFMVPFTIIRMGHVLFFGLSVDVELHPHAPHLQSQRYLAPSLLWMEFAEVFWGLFAYWTLNNLCQVANQDGFQFSLYFSIDI